jgi:hypothetical protein
MSIQSFNSYDSEMQDSEEDSQIEDVDVGPRAGDAGSRERCPDCGEFLDDDEFCCGCLTFH